jgi:hypothetical protein
MTVPPAPERPLSVTDAFSPAIERVKTMLFKPVSAGAWFTLGFVAFLDQLGHGGGGGSFNIQVPGGGGGGGGGSGGGGSSPDEVFGQIRDWVTAHLGLVIAIGAAILLIGLAVGLAIQYLGARGAFMYIDNVARGTAEVKEPWRRSARHAWSYFLWRIVFGIASFLLVIALLVPGGFVVYGWVTTKTAPGAGGIALLVLSGLLFFAVMIVLIVISMFLRDFVAPLMARFDLTCTAAWWVFLGVARVNKAQLLIYILLQIAFAMAYGTAGMLVACFTCCLGALPVIHQTLMQPLLYFERAWSLEILGQLGEAYRLFPPPPEEPLEVLPA